MAIEKILLMKGGAKASSRDLSVAMDELTMKLHPDAHKVFPQGRNSIPGIITSDSKASTRAISYVFFNRFEQKTF